MVRRCFVCGRAIGPTGYVCPFEMPLYQSAPGHTGGMMKKSKLDKALDREIEKAYIRLAQGVQVHILDIPKIFADAKIEHSAGVPIEQAMPAIIERYRVKV